jgi:pyruvate dehydrogenase E1 component
MAYDPTYAYELAVIIHDGLRRMNEKQENIFYYLTVTNENYPQPSLPAGAEADIVRGMYRLSATSASGEPARVRLLGSGAILREVIAAAEMLRDDWRVTSEVWSVTSFSELAREARDVERANRLQPSRSLATSHVERCLPGRAPVVAATDYVRAYPQLIASYIEPRLVALGTDGFGRSDTRTALRGFFEIDRRHVAVAALRALAQQGSVSQSTVANAIEKYGIDARLEAPWSR